MKTENLGESHGNVIWINNVEFTTQEENLPVIGPLQLSTIFSNVEANRVATQSTGPETNTVTVYNNDPRLPLAYPEGNLNNFIVLNDDNVIIKKPAATDDEKAKSKPKNNEKDNFEDMLYFACNLCPFLCTQDTKITEHLAVAHKNKTRRKLIQLKCPACKNIFYHKVSLRSHLVHDHGVSNSDLNRIIQAVTFYANENNKSKTKNKKTNTDEIKVNEESEQLQDKAAVLDEDSSEKNASAIEDHDEESTEINSFENNEIYTSGGNDENILAVQEKTEPRAIALPQLDIVNSTEKIFNTMIPQVGKTTEEKVIHRCIMPHCKVQMQDANKMVYHMKCHKGESFKCIECNEPFSFWKPLSSHLWRIHKFDMELFSCDKCDYKTYSLAKLNNVHKLIHSDVKAYACPCGKAFKNAKQLRNHMTIHKKDNRTMWACETCCKQFSDKRQLTVHLDSVHKKIKPFLCSYCGYKGSSRSSLKMHIRQHTGEKPFSCDECSYATSDHNSLRRHKLRHTGHKPYKCTFCSYACIQSSTYKVHLKTKHPGLGKDLMFTCEECPFRTVNKEKFTAHVMTTHSTSSSSKDT